MTLARRCKGRMTQGGFAMFIHRAGHWLWWFEPTVPGRTTSDSGRADG